MISLVLTIVCSTSIGLILKYNDVHRGHPVILLAGNYFTAMTISFLFVLSGENSAFSSQTILFGMFLGILFVVSFFAFAKAVGAAGAALASVSSRMSVIIPVVLSILIFNEIPSLSKIAGFFFTILTILLFYFSLKRMPGAGLHLMDYFYLFAVLTGIGINDFSMKIFSHWRPLEEQPVFLLVIFTSAFLYSAGYLLYKKIPLDSGTVTSGLILGVPNVFSTYFLLGALGQLPAIVVYPSVNIGVILLTALGAVLMFKETINHFGKLALLAGLAAIILLGI